MKMWKNENVKNGNIENENVKKLRCDKGKCEKMKMRKKWLGQGWTNIQEIQNAAVQRLSPVCDNINFIFFWTSMCSDKEYQPEFRSHSPSNFIKGPRSITNSQWLGGRFGSVSAGMFRFCWVRFWVKATSFLRVSFLPFSSQKGGREALGANFNRCDQKKKKQNKKTKHSQRSDYELVGHCKESVQQTCRIDYVERFM